MFLWVSVALFTLAAITGVGMATFHFKQKLPPNVMPLLKLLFAVGGVITLIIGIFNETPGVPARVALGLFALAAVGGALMGMWHFRGKTAPKGMILLHAAFAVCGYIALWVELLGLVAPTNGAPA